MARLCTTWFRAVGAGLLAAWLALLVPAYVWADAPVTRGPDQTGQGSLATPSTAQADPTSWVGASELAPVALPLTTNNFTPSAPESSAIAWLGRNLNPGNWILDAGMGIFAGIVKMFGGMVQKATTAFLGSASVLPSGCDNAATNFVFCTPANLTYAHPGVQAVWAVLRGVAASLVTILFTVRLGRMMVAGSRALAIEGKELLLAFVLAMTWIQATGPICQLIIEFFNGLSNLLLAKAALSFPSQDVGDLNLGANVLFLVLWVAILLLMLKSFGRLVQIIVLLAVAPLAGALLIDRATSSRFRGWFEKLIELLLAQLNLVIVFIVIAAILEPYQSRAAGDAFISILLSIVMIGMALSGKSAIGIAGAAVSSGGALGWLRYQAAGSALRALAGGTSQRGEAGRAVGSQPDPQVRAAIDHSQRVIQARNARTSGDPTASAAAQRQDQTPGDSTQPHAAFRMRDAGDGFSSKRATARYQAASPASESGRREQALMRSTLMRQRAEQLRAGGDATGAATLARKAQLQRQFGRGKQLTRPARFSADERVQRRAAYRTAQAEVAGMHALERDGLTDQIQRDETRLPIVQRDLALASTTGTNTAALASEHAAIDARLAASRARLATIAPDAHGTPALATRQAAAALANEHLPQPLRSRQYALRYGAAKGSAFVRRLAGGPTSAARDELARARAYAARTAHIPISDRPPMVAQRNLRVARPAADQQRPARAYTSALSALRRHRAPVGGEQDER